MTSDIYEDETFSAIDFTSVEDLGKEYYNCIFTDCNFSGADLSHITFIECKFIASDLKMVRMANTTLRDVVFTKCNCLGVNFFECNKFMFSIKCQDSNLHLASFNLLKLKNFEIVGCNLKEADFTETDLTGATFDRCDLENAVFSRSNLMGANLSTSFHFSIDPEDNRLKGAQFSMDGLPGLLHKYDIKIE